MTYTHPMIHATATKLATFREVHRRAVVLLVRYRRALRGTAPPGGPSLERVAGVSMDWAD
jgi:hypothetical protein